MTEKHEFCRIEYADECRMCGLAESEPCHFVQPELFIQWKGTEVCADFRCSCGRSGHIHADFCYEIRCGACGRVWDVPHTLMLTPSEEDEPRVIAHMDDPQDTDWVRP